MGFQRENWELWLGLGENCFFRSIEDITGVQVFIKGKLVRGQRLSLDFFLVERGLRCYNFCYLMVRDGVGQFEIWNYLEYL